MYNKHTKALYAAIISSIVVLAISFVQQQQQAKAQGNQTGGAAGSTNKTSGAPGSNRDSGNATGGGTAAGGSTGGSPNY